MPESLELLDADALADLIVRARAGDPGAGDELARSLAPVLRDLHRGWSDPLHASEDFAQESMLRILQNLEKAPTGTPGAFYAWITRVAISARIDANRKVRASVRGGKATIESINESAHAVGPGSDPHRLAERREQTEKLRRAVSVLRPDDRWILAESYENDRTQRDIGNDLGVSDATMSRRVQDIMETLRKEVDR